MGVSVNRVFLSLGSNIDKEHNLPAAVALLRQWTKVTAVSGAYETPPKGLTTQPCFLNAAVLIETPLNAEQIKEALIGRVEQALGRERTADKNAPRTIDLDIALFNDEVFDYMPGDGRLRHVPDPDLLAFAHAIVPLAELAPDELHPENGQRLADLARDIVAADASGEGQLLRRDEIVL
jgi:2-amino-4-hydroxy-6-hydroxymethyldihydropteridine diphosphokinase